MGCRALEAKVSVFVFTHLTGRLRIWKVVGVSTLRGRRAGPGLKTQPWGLLSPG